MLQLKIQISGSLILGSGGLAIMIPPSGLAVLLGVIAELWIGQILIAIILPGIITAILYSRYIVGRCEFDADVATSFKVEPIPRSEKIHAAVIENLACGMLKQNDRLMPP